MVELWQNQPLSMVERITFSMSKMADSDNYTVLLLTTRFHGPEPSLAIGLSLSPVRKFGTVCWSLSGMQTLLTVLSVSSRHIFLTLRLTDSYPSFYTVMPNWFISFAGWALNYKFIVISQSAQ